MTTDKQYHYFYKITNKVNGHFYYGIHSTKNLNDGYMGSGKRLHYAYKKYGIECFEKEILVFFDTRKEASEYEAEVVNEILISDKNCYNIYLGGDNTYMLGTVTAKDVCGNIVQIPQKEFYDNPDKYVGVTRNKVLVKTKTNQYMIVDKDDDRLKTGELTLFWKGRHHKEETKEKQRKTFKLIRHQQGVKNSQYGTCWIMKDDISKKIKKCDLDKYISEGWIKGRKCKRK